VENCWGVRMTPQQTMNFYRKIDISSGGTEGCWLWTGAKTDKGYGQARQNDKALYAHRISYEHFHGTTIPDGMYIDHKCRTPLCVNPIHLRIVTPRLNMIENSMSVSSINHAKTCCPHGHSYNEGHAYYRKDGSGKFCITCQKIRLGRV
jgi:hypothetical protein